MRILARLLVLLLLWVETVSSTPVMSPFHLRQRSRPQLRFKGMGALKALGNLGCTVVNGFLQVGGKFYI